MAHQVRVKTEILTSQEARELLKIGRTKLWELTRTAKIPAYRIGPGKTSGLRYKKADLMQWLEQNRINGLDNVRTSGRRAELASGASRSDGPRP